MEKNVVILGLFINGASIVRHLRLKGYKVYGITHRTLDEGLLSPYGKKLICPDPENAYKDWVAFMCSFGRTFRDKPVILPTTDKYVLAMNRAAGQLASAFRMHGFHSQLRTKLTVKTEQLRLAGAHGFPITRWAVVRSKADLTRFAKATSRKIIIKPAVSHEWHEGKAQERIGNAKVMIGRSKAELSRIYDLVSPYSKKLLAMEYIGGTEENLYYWTGFITKGKVRGRLVGKKSRVTPIHLGSASYVELVDIPEIEDQCERFLRRLKYEGICGIEVKQDPDDKKFKLIEINPRYGLWEEIGIPVGVDIARQAVDSLYHEETAVIRPRSFNQRWISLHRDLPVISGYLQEGMSLRQLLASFKPPVLINDLVILDPVYTLRFGLRNIWSILGRIFGRR